MNSRLYCCLILLMALACNESGQKPPEPPSDKLLSAFNKIRYWSEYKGEIDPTDSLVKYNQLFQKDLLTYAAQFPYDSAFEQMDEEGLNITSSPDSLFIIYSWDTWTGGTMHFFENVYQYKNADRLYSKLIRDTVFEGDPGVFYSEIYSLPVEGSTYYLAKCHAIYSSRDGYQGIKVFTISDSNLVDTVKLFKTKEGMSNSLDFSFEFREIGPDQLIGYDSNTKTITVPLLVNDSITDKKIAYTFNGRFFEEKN